MEPCGRWVAMAVGEVVPGTPYRLLSWLGDGGMGAVFEALHVDTERRVAVKVLHPRRRSLKWVVDGFRNEARASARIGSPNIVDIYDFKELDDGRLLIAMEFLDGPTLHKQTALEPLGWPRLVAVARQVCKGIAAAHRAGIVHRDIKPENIMLVRRDLREDFVKILDFGVAHFTRDGSTSRVSGTAQYMAPEVSLGSTDARSDIYSLGCLLYTLAVGHPPFEGATPAETLSKQRNEEPTPPSRRAPGGVPCAFDALVLRCLAKDADDRFQTAEELEAALCELQIEQGWRTRWDDLPAPSVEPSRRVRIDAGLSALLARPRRRPWWPVTVVASLIAAVLVAVLAWPRSEPTASRDQLEPYVLAAQRAAARFYFVYPPAFDPQGSTAYREVLALEAVADPGAMSRAAELREEFSRTLVRLGDRYWDFEGARPFAYEYYASALVFADHERAASRAGLSVAALERLRQHAADGDFTLHELQAIEPLFVLAEPDPGTRAAELQAMRSRGVIPASVAASIDRMLEHPEHGRTIEVVDRVDGPLGRPPEPAVTDESTTGGQEPADTDTDTDANAEVAEPARERTKPARDPAAARALVTRAGRADETGDRSGAETLYNRALEADPRCVEAFDGLADIAFRRARYGESARRLERAVALGPGDPGRWLKLGDAYFKTVRYSDARSSYERAQELGSSAAAGRLAKLDRKLGEGQTDR